MAYKILVAIPVLTGADHCKQAIDSVVNQPGVDLLIIDNGATPEVKDLISSYNAPNGVCITNEVNRYVNPAWNQSLIYFLNGDWDYICVMNSDLVLREDWVQVVQKRWVINPHEILLPVMNEQGHSGSEVMEAKYVSEATPGVFITLNRKQATMVYPIPEDIKVWFGDQYIYTILRELGYQTVIPPNLCARHAWSSTVSRLPGISEIIEEDKIQWADVVEPLMRQRIQFLKDKL